MGRVEDKDNLVGEAILAELGVKMITFTCEFCGCEKKFPRPFIARKEGWQETKRGWKCRECYEAGE